MPTEGVAGFHSMNHFFTNKGLIALASALFFLSPAARADGDISALPARTSPDWLRNGVIYEIFPRDFSPAGNLAGVTAKLDDLHNLGVNILWLMPIHPIGQKFRKGEFGSPYSVRDYYAIDPDYGTLQDFRQLVAGAHQRGMKVIMDLVANHTSWDSVMMTNKAFYKQDAQGHVISPVPDWSDVAGLNYANPALRQYMIAMLKYWIREGGVDGFRCDAAPMVPTDFWEQVRTELAAVKPDIMLLDEGEQPALLVKAFDVDYSWKFLWTVNDVINHGAPASALRRSWEESRAAYPRNALRMRISDDHDETRAIARYGVYGAEAASALMFTLDGVPLLYNGMEAGDATESADPALFDKATICWHPHQNDRPPFRTIYHDLIQLRKENPAFRTADVQWVPNSSESTLVTFIRSDDKDQFLVAINFSNRPIDGQITIQDAGRFTAVKLEGLESSGSNPLPALHLNGFEWRIYHRTNSAVAAK
jgi:cyclomaltodextrinase